MTSASRQCCCGTSIGVSHPSHTDESAAKHAAECFAEHVKTCAGALRAENAELRARVGRLERDVREARRLPNGWAQPCFVSVDDDGCLGVEWIFGEQGGPESWRVSFHWTPDEGAFTIRTPYDLSAQKVVEGRDAATFLARTLAGTGDLEPAEGEAK